MRTSPCGEKTAPCFFIVCLFLFGFGLSALFSQGVGGALCFRALLIWGVVVLLRLYISTAGPPAGDKIFTLSPTHPPPLAPAVSFCAPSR